MIHNPSIMSTTSTSTATAILLGCGVAAGPIYVVVGLTEAFTREYSTSAGIR